MPTKQSVLHNTFHAQSCPLYSTFWLMYDYTISCKKLKTVGNGLWIH